MEESNEELRVIPGKCNAEKLKLENVSVYRARSCNVSFPDFRALLSDSEISIGWTPERDCKGKLARNMINLLSCIVQ